uniref:Peptidase S59 domain-containing protein n=1 Tax=Vannella robusta TaxID=1487602 RepID=A0A7S4IT70_9EUKA|mmetsp:Transcript_825/g.1042  ORF Transcript_825/g.1042 Transcript_825/m.1042 type:complete len:205 (+) Transcript_825:40-654(+)
MNESGSLVSMSLFGGAPSGNTASFSAPSGNTSSFGSSFGSIARFGGSSGNTTGFGGSGAQFSFASQGGIPIFKNKDYYCDPKSIHECTNPRAVENFKIGRHGIGEIQFLQPIDMRSLVNKVLDEIVIISSEGVTMYPNDKAPERGYALNIPATVVFHNISIPKHCTKENFVSQLRRNAERTIHQTFVSYNETTEELVTTVQYFV